MADTLKDVGRHIGSYGNGHYEATVGDTGGVIITTVLDDAEQRYTVNLSRIERDRLAAWVEWQRKKIYQTHNRAEAIKNIRTARIWYVWLNLMMQC